jgi:riboflavin biosynthesis pyrimidine reductase
VKDFEILFDRGEPALYEDAAYGSYGWLGFPAPPPERPWIFSNFVETLDGVASLLGRHASGADISQSPEDRWLMDLLRAHADAVLMGVGTLVDEARRMKRPRGPVFDIADERLLALRRRMKSRREMNIFVTGSAALDLSAYAVFDGKLVDTAIITTRAGAATLEAKRTHPHVKLIRAGEGKLVDLPAAMKVLRSELGIEYLLCEGGPTLNGTMAKAGLIDERFLTVSPVEAGIIVPPEQEPAEYERAHPPQRRPTTFSAPGFTKATMTWWRWLSCRKAGDHQFNRYRRR